MISNDASEIIDMIIEMIEQYAERNQIAPIQAEELYYMVEKAILDLDKAYSPDPKNDDTIDPFSDTDLFNY